MAAAFANAAPLSGNQETSGSRRAGHPDDNSVDTQWGFADVGFVELLRVPLLAGWNSQEAVNNIEKLVDGQALRDGITGGGGWTALLELFAKAVANQE